MARNEYAFMFAVIASIMLVSGCIGNNPPGNQTPGGNGTGACMCTLEYAPVCGTDGVTYGNSCGARCANATIAHTGECAAAAPCQDSDGGRDVSAKGTLTTPAGSLTDTCKDASSVDEYYCSGNISVKETVPCPSGYGCVDGFCATAGTPPSLDVCADSDGGQAFGVAGNATVGNLTYSDTCTDLALVREYYCDGDAAQSMIHPCDSGERCMDGRCVVSERFCEETDSGNDALHKGVVTSGTILSSNEMTDICEDGKLREYYCDGTASRSALSNCPAGYECRNGACRELECDDSDGGQDRDERGTASDDSGNYADTCASATAVNEYYCVGSVVQSTTLNCASGDICSGGKCIPSPPAAPCTDSDGGMDSNVFGTTSKGGSFNSDYCINMVWQTEFYCDSSDNIAWVENECPGSCDSGVCIY